MRAEGDHEVVFFSWQRRKGRRGERNSYMLGVGSIELFVGKDRAKRSPLKSGLLEGGVTKIKRKDALEGV